MKIHSSIHALFLKLLDSSTTFPVGKYMFKVNDKNT